MSEQARIYNGFYKSQDRFATAHCREGFEPDVISDYIYWAMIIASYHEPGSKSENPLLCELHLRKVYSDLLSAISNTRYTATFRRVCLDSIHTPLLALKRYYYQFENGDITFMELKQQLQYVQAPLD
ncbi:hypothetical protein [Vibrio sp. SCSIO 43137]|uniref:hypothetical protein n=1 Tax=Vibrio sp. SCSIO 43137 TaxID=3021011 RepID=UPI0023078F8E|nr:hypothetical protein [Vibrio sp. SCSIO 43137]WCE31353.1 hypothetical protein PK654_19625 [Vibrio sp. SCSIO 43137]